MLLTHDLVTSLCCNIAFGTGIYRTLDECLTRQGFENAC